MAIHLWVRSGHVEISSELSDQCSNAEADLTEKPSLEADALAHAPQKQQSEPIDRQLSKPILLILLAHLSGLIPLYLLNHTPHSVSLSPPLSSSPAILTHVTTNTTTPPQHLPPKPAWSSPSSS